MVDSTLEELLVNGLVEPFQAGWVANVLCFSDDDWQDDEEPPMEDVLRAVVGAVRSLLEEGLAEVGDLNYEDDAPLAFTPWGLDVERTLERIDAAWRALGRMPGAFDLFWVRNTPAGDAVARAALQRGGR